MTHKQTSRRRRHRRHRHRHRSRSSVCRRHPSAKPTTGVCSACLRERLASIDGQSPPSSSSDSSAVLANELRRTRSYSALDASGAAFEQPRRRSCDVKSGSSSLHHLFAADYEERVSNPSRAHRVPDLKEEEEEDDDEEEEIPGFDDREERKMVNDDSDDGVGEYKTMKEFIDLEWEKQTKKNNGRDLKEIASVLGKKLSKLSLKHQKSKRKEKNSHSRFAGEIHTAARSEIDDHGLGRRSCDKDTRVSLDVGRATFEEARASWDGCLMAKTYPKPTPLDSVTKAVKASPQNNAGGKDEEEERKPGGSAQTREYYSDSRRRKSFDRSSSVKRQGLLEVDELKAISNTKISPETIGLFHGAQLLVTEKELRDSNWYSIKSYKHEDTGYSSKGVDCVAGEVKQDGFGLKKPRRKWPKGWSIWGFMQRKNEKKHHEVKAERSSKLEGNVIDGSLSESLWRLRRAAKVEANGDVSQKLIRSYSVSARKSCDGVFHGTAINGFEGGRSSCDGMFYGSITSVEAKRSSCDGFFHGIEAKGFSEKSKESNLLQRNMTTNANTGIYSPNNLENGLLRFYLTPVRSHRMNKSWKSRLMNPSSVMGSAI